MRLLPIIDDTPRPYDHPKQHFLFRVRHVSKRGEWFIWATHHSAARYAVAKQQDARNALYNAGGFRASKVKAYPNERLFKIVRGDGSTTFVSAPSHAKARVKAANYYVYAGSKRWPDVISCTVMKGAS